MKQELEYVVPERMLEAVYKELRTAEYRERWGTLENKAGLAVYTAIQWLAEHPIEPDMDQLSEIMDLAQRQQASLSSTISYAVIEWQRRMFLAPKEEMIGEESVGQYCARYQTIGEAVVEAYRRGKNSK